MAWPLIMNEAVACVQYGFQRFVCMAAHACVSCRLIQPLAQLKDTSYFTPPSSAAVHISLTGVIIWQTTRKMSSCVCLCPPVLTPCPAPRDSAPNWGTSWSPCPTALQSHSPTALQSLATSWGSEHSTPRQHQQAPPPTPPPAVMLGLGHAVPRGSLPWQGLSLSLRLSMFRSLVASCVPMHLPPTAPG